MKKSALLILAQGFEEIEAMAVIDILRRGDVALSVAALDRIDILSARHVLVYGDKLLRECGSDYDAIILPGGGKGADNLRHSREVASLLLTFHNKNKVIAAICASPAVVLAPLNILNSRRATCFPGMEEHFGASTAFVPDAVVVDGNIITGRGPACAVEFALAILERITDKITAAKVRSAILA